MRLILCCFRKDYYLLPGRWGRIMLVLFLLFVILFPTVQRYGFSIFLNYSFYFHIGRMNLNNTRNNQIFVCSFAWFKCVIACIFFSFYFCRFVWRLLWNGMENTDRLIIEKCIFNAIRIFCKQRENNTKQNVILWCREKLFLFWIFCTILQVFSI
jgi:hypothetical protein